MKAVIVEFRERWKEDQKDKKRYTLEETCQNFYTSGWEKAIDKCAKLVKDKELKELIKSIKTSD